MPEHASEQTARTDLQSQYAAQVSADLDSNTREQERVAAEITALQGKLKDLERDHGLLLTMRQALAAKDGAQEKPPAAARVPKARRAADSESTPAKRTTKATGKRAAAVKSAPAKATSPKSSTPAKAATTKPAAKADTPADTKPEAKTGTKANAKAGAKTGTAKAATKSAAKSPKGGARSGRRSAAGGGPTLREVIGAMLAGYSEPRSAAEVTQELAAAHPERKAGATVVRNTLEALVAKGHAHRSKQQKSVFYTAVTPAATTPAEADTPSV
ncbi:hypothetical protein [Streptomyces sp. NPDC058045]|uniref:hypothetical protein n=1 Tax=Streptomyces sp. NPDC058045 TaxID=3346311 RepID=UPI0036E41EBE